MVPIAQQGHEKSIGGFFVAGISPHRQFDQQYRGFIELISGQIGAALTNARAYEDERKRAEALEEIDRAKTTFFSNVSHEFRTPLTLLLGPLEDLLSSPQSTGPEALGKIELAHRNGIRLLRLVNTLLDFSRIEAGRMQASYEPTALAEFTADIASSFRSAIERAGMRLRVDITPLPQHVYVDRDMWEKILLNLLSNAFKFTFEGEISVSVAAAPDGKGAVVKVADTGIGIPADELPRLFERFHRVAGAQGRSFEGSGIGLALVHELIRLHGGAISVESTPGQGTTFTLQVPFGHAHLPAEHVRAFGSVSGPIKAQPYVDEALRWLPEAGASNDSIFLPSLSPDAAEQRSMLAGIGKRVLLADDNQDMRDYVQRLLLSQGYEVQALENGQRALEAARRTRPDLILTDVMMPQLDGFGLLKAVRQHPQLADIPVIMLSARAGEEAKIEGLEAGVDDYLVKPFAARELLARVNSNIQMAAVRREAARAVMQSEQRYLMTQERLTLALSTGRVAVYDWDVDTDRLSVQGPMAEIFGVAVEEAAKGLPLQSFLEGIHPDDRAQAAALVANTVNTGAAFEAEYRTLGMGQLRAVLSRGRIERGPSGQRLFSGVLIDLTEQKQAEARLRDQTRALEILNRLARSISSDLDLQRVANAAIDGAVELTGAIFGAFFYVAFDDEAQPRLHRVTAGHAAVELEFPSDVPQLDEMFSTAELVFGPDVFPSQSSRDTSICSSIAVAVRSHTGRILGAFVLGHSSPEAFGSAAQERISALAAQLAVAIDNVHLFQAAQREIEQRRRAEAELQRVNASLEQRVAAEVANRLQTEEALRQAQKMEAIGQLTGGVAHDFNNLLTAIIGGLDTIRRSRLEDSARIQRATNMALQGAQRAANLTSRLLAFSRRQPLDPKPLDINVLVRDMTDLLHRTIGETIELEGVLAPRLWRVEIDQNQLENAILNLAVNARDAMPNGGKLTIETANTALDESYSATDVEVIPGQYVQIAVSDTGSGMSKSTLARAFEPFFTTKEPGRGTGLGLSMVYGFVKQSGGHVTIYSEEGEGTTVKLYFPRYLGVSDEGSDRGESPVPIACRGEVVLVVEDNEDVRSYSVSILSELGYQVLEAADAETALEMMQRIERVDLLFTDVILPGKNGRELADLAQQKWPLLRVLYTTGYSRNAIVHHGRLDPGVQLITKPFTFEQLANRVRDCLDRAQ